MTKDLSQFATGFKLIPFHVEQSSYCQLKHLLLAIASQHVYIVLLYCEFTPNGSLRYILTFDEFFLGHEDHTSDRVHHRHRNYRILKNRPKVADSSFILTQLAF